jgi:hypothetical protein
MRRQVDGVAVDAGVREVSLVMERARGLAVRY